MYNLLFQVGDRLIKRFGIVSRDGVKQIDGAGVSLFHHIVVRIAPPFLGIDFPIDKSNRPEYRLIAELFRFFEHPLAENAPRRSQVEVVFSPVIL